MADILGLLRAAIQPATEARVGYLQGQQEAADKAVAAQRQSVLDQMKQQLNDAQVKNDLAQAERAARPPVVDTRTFTDDNGNVYTIPVTGGTATPVTDQNGKPLIGKKAAAKAPDTLNTSKGILYWDPDSGSYKPTGYQAPENPNGITPADRAAANERTNAQIQLRTDLAEVPRPSKAPDAPKPVETVTTPAGNTFTTGGGAGGPLYSKAVSDSLAYEKTTLQPDRERQRRATAPASLGTEGGGSPPPNSGAGSTGAANGEHALGLAAQDAISRIMASSLSDADKQQRVQAVNQRLADAVTRLRGGQ